MLRNCMELTTYLHSTSPVVCMGSDQRTGKFLTGRNRPEAAARTCLRIKGQLTVLKIYKNKLTQAVFATDKQFHCLLAFMFRGFKPISGQKSVFGVGPIGVLS